MTVVLDSSAVLAISFDEPGRAAVDAILGQAVISAVNASEVMVKLIDKGDTPDLASESMRAPDPPVLPLCEAPAVQAALLRPVTRPDRLSLGDGACLALARSLNAPVMTADRVWAALDVGVEIRVIR